MLIITCTIFALASACLGWWKDTRQLHRRPGSKWSNDTLPPHRIRSHVLSRRRRRRLFTTAEFGAYGAVFGAGLFWALQYLSR